MYWKGLMPGLSDAPLTIAGSETRSELSFKWRSVISTRECHSTLRGTVRASLGVAVQVGYFRFDPLKVQDKERVNGQDKG